MPRRPACCAYARSLVTTGLERGSRDIIEHMQLLLTYNINSRQQKAAVKNTNGVKGA
jgi:hypothetical protein